jgi:hypothetical protein
MNLNDLDEDEFAHLVQWLTANPLGPGPIDLRIAPAWRFAEARFAVEARKLVEFPGISDGDLSDGGQ